MDEAVPPDKCLVYKYTFQELFNAIFLLKDCFIMQNIHDTQVRINLTEDSERLKPNFQIMSD